MTFQDRVAAVAKLGFTERQARFLVLVMLHSGVCLLRQYSAFAGIVHGEKTRRFFAELVRRKYAVAYRCRHNRGRVYHVQSKALYRAIGAVDSRFRRLDRLGEMRRQFFVDVVDQPIAAHGIDEARPQSHLTPSSARD